MPEFREISDNCRTKRSDNCRKSVHSAERHFQKLPLNSDARVKKRESLQTLDGRNGRLVGCLQQDPTPFPLGVVLLEFDMPVFSSGGVKSLRELRAAEGRPVSVPDHVQVIFSQYQMAFLDGSAALPNVAPSLQRTQPTKP